MVNAYTGVSLTDSTWAPDPSDQSLIDYNLVVKLNATDVGLAGLDPERSEVQIEGFSEGSNSYDESSGILTTQANSVGIDRNKNDVYIEFILYDKVGNKYYNSTTVSLITCQPGQKGKPYSLFAGNHEKGCLDQGSQAYSFNYRYDGTLNPLWNNSLPNWVDLSKYISGQSRGLRNYWDAKALQKQYGEPFEVHHLVGQYGQNIYRFGRQAIDNPVNTIPIPTKIHRQLTRAWNVKPDKNTLSLAEKYKDASYEEQWKAAAELLESFGFKVPPPQ